jgi:hypothetical protein
MRSLAIGIAALRLFIGGVLPGLLLFAVWTFQSSAQAPSAPAVQQTASPSVPHVVPPAAAPAQSQPMRAGDILAQQLGTLAVQNASCSERASALEVEVAGLKHQIELLTKAKEPQK